MNNFDKQSQSEAKAVELKGTVPEKVLRAFFAEFELAGIEYCVMRNFRQLPQTVGTSDLDILIRPTQHRLAERAIGRVLGRLGGRVVARVPARGSYLKTMGCTDGCWWGLAIDLVADVDYGGLVYITADDVLSRSRLHNDVRVASDDDAAIGALAKEMLNNLEADAKYTEDARAVWRQDGDASMASLVIFSPNMRVEIGNFLEGRATNDAKTIRHLGIRMRRELNQHNGILKRWHAIYSELLRRISRVCRRPGALIAVDCESLDVAAKLIDGILPTLKRAFHNRVLLGCGGPQDIIHGAASNETQIAWDAVSPDTARQIGFAGLLWEYVSGYYLRIYPKMVSRPHLVCINQYYGTVMQQMKGKVGLCRLLRATIPKPDLVLRIRKNPLGEPAADHPAAKLGSEGWFGSASRCLELESESGSGNQDKALKWIMEELAIRTAGS